MYASYSRRAESMVGEDIHQCFCVSCRLRTRIVLGHLIFLGHGSGLLAFLRQQDRVDVRQDPTGRDRDRTQQLGQFLVVSDGQLDVSRYDSGLFVVSGGVPGEFENFRR
jgi:hypothetical protein